MKHPPHTTKVFITIIPILLLAACETPGGDIPDPGSGGETIGASKPSEAQPKWFPYYSNSFSHYDTGTDEPEGLLLLDGDFSVAKIGDNKVLTLPPEPLDDFGVLFGPRIPGNLRAQAKFLSSKSGRRVPAFALGIGGVDGFRAKLNLAHRQFQLVREGEVLAEVPFIWESDQWATIMVQREKVKDEPETWAVKAKAWQGEEPAEWGIELESDAKQSAGKCSVWAAPYSTRHIHIDDLTVFSANPLGAP